MDSNFDETVTQFRAFLVKNGYPGNLIWVNPDDVLLSGSKVIFVRMPVPISNEDAARRLFDSANRQQKGILFGTLCEIDNATCVYAWMPRTDSEKESALISDRIKMSAKIGSSRLKGEVIRKPAKWSELSRKYQDDQAAKEELFR